MEKLFYEDCNCREFTATVTGCAAVDGGWAVTLNRTAFYPEGGGQACDIGTLGGVNVLDVQEKGDRILHLCDGALEVGAVVAGEICWERRFDLMQQHTGEHIVSGLIHKKFGYHNTGFHVGKGIMEVDFDGPIDPESLAQIEAEANAAVWQDIPLKCWIPDPEELKTVFYRTKRALPWPVRIVQVPGYDSCACCGIHVATTGQVGLIKILSCTKFHQGVRLEMVCGQRAYQYMVKYFEENRRVSQAFSAKMDATGEAARKMNDLLAAEKAKVAALQNRIFDSIGKCYVNRSTAIHFEADLEPSQVRQLAEKILANVEDFCAVFSGVDGQYNFCLASRERDLRPLGKELTAQLNGRGGGKPHFQQGSLPATKEQILAFFAEFL